MDISDAECKYRSKYYLLSVYDDEADWIYIDLREYKIRIGSFVPIEYGSTMGFSEFTLLKWN